MTVKPKFALIIRTPPPPDYMRFNETLYADRTITELIPQWRNQVSWRIVIHELPRSPDVLKELISKHVKEYDFKQDYHQRVYRY